LSNKAKKEMYFSIVILLFIEAEAPWRSKV